MSTIDPGVEDTIEKDAQIANQRRRDEGDFHDPSRWWFASTACPLLAGTFGPIANGLSICALVFSWRLRIPPGKTEAEGIKLPDPHWLIAINVVSLIAALSGNASLLLNMARRLRFTIAQPITIAGFLLAGILLIIDMAILTSSPTYYLTDPALVDPKSHALSSAFYYAISASTLYIIIGLLMSVTVYGANRGYYERDFSLTSPQRTLMLQTMLFITYLLLGALVFSKIEGWEFLDAVYWADVTLLTIGLGDYSPATHLGRSLLFPFAVGGILIIGLVIGSIRSLVLERGEEKLGARITEKRRSTATHNVDHRNQTIKISYFARVDFVTDPSLSPVQRREQEFKVMRKVQAAAERERRYYGLATSSIFVLLLWFLGAVVFMVAEEQQGWTYFQALYFTYLCLLTIGYGDLVPVSNSGKAFFVVWSILAVPSLTILISNMGDTIVKWFSDLTIYVGSITVLPSEHGFRASAKSIFEHLAASSQQSFPRFTPPGILAAGSKSQKHDDLSAEDHKERIRSNFAERLQQHFEEEELELAAEAGDQGDDLERDIHFYHYVLSCECRHLQNDLSNEPPKQYSWEEWEYFLRLMGTEDEGDQDADTLVPDNMRLRSPNAQPPSDGHVRARSRGRSSAMHATGRGHASSIKHLTRKLPKPHRRHKPFNIDDWSWLSSDSPLMSSSSETGWLIERLGIVLERELNRQRKGVKKRPPVGWSDLDHVLGGMKEQA